MVRIARRTIERDVTVSNVMAYDIPIPIQSISNRINLAYTHFYSLVTNHVITHACGRLLTFPSS